MLVVTDHAWLIFTVIHSFITNFLFFPYYYCREYNNNYNNGNDYYNNES